jgi:hypothetical protein
MPASKKHKRPVFVLALRPEPRVDAIRALRVPLKVLLRPFGLRAIRIEEREADDVKATLNCSRSCLPLGIFLLRNAAHFWNESPPHSGSAVSVSTTPLATRCGGFVTAHRRRERTLAAGKHAP